MPRPYVYRRLCQQPIDIRFHFTTGTLSEWNSDGSHNQFADEQEGFPQVFISLSGQEYGPYQTAFKTTYRAWIYRRSLRPTPESQRIQSQVSALYGRLMDVWQSFPQNGPTITADMMLQKAGLQVFSLAEGGAVYVR